MPDVWAQYHTVGKGSKMQQLLGGEPCFVVSPYNNNLVAQLEEDVLRAVAASQLNSPAENAGRPAPSAAAASHISQPAQRGNNVAAAQQSAQQQPAAAAAQAPAEDLQVQTVKLRGMLCCAACAAYEGDGPMSELRRLLALSVAIGGSLTRGGASGSTLLLILPAVTAQAVVAAYAQAAGKQVDLQMISAALQGPGAEGVFSVVALPPALDQPMLAVAVGALIESSVEEALQAMEHSDPEFLEKKRVPALMDAAAVLAAILSGGPQCLERGKAEVAAQGLVSLLLDAQHAWEEFAAKVLGPVAPSAAPAATSTPRGHASTSTGGSAVPRTSPPAAGSGARSTAAPAQQRVQHVAPAPAGTRQAAQPPGFQADVAGEVCRCAFAEFLCTHR